MQDELRRKHLAELIASLDVLSGAQFERFCYRFVDEYAPRNWDHRGTNVGGAPVSGIVDSVAEVGHSVAQYSSESDYFSGDLTKIKNDLRMAKAKHANLNELLLISTRTCGPVAKTKTKQLEAKALEDGLVLEILDAQKVAEYIIDNLHSGEWVKGLAEYVPVLGKWQAEWALTHAVPMYQNYVSRPDDELAIRTRLLGEKLLRVRGLSGMGKSAVCSAVATGLASSFYSVLWVQASSITRAEQLMEFAVESSGSSVNLIGLLRTRPCLLVMDDLRVDLSHQQLLAGAHPDSCVLISSQQGRGDAYALTTLGEALARKVVEGNAVETCPEDVWIKIWTAVGGYPLLLELLGRIAKDDGWPAATDLCPHAVQLDDEQYQKVCNRILARHESALRRELAFVRWLDSSVIDPLILRAGAGVAARHLDARGLLTPSKDALVRIHDLVFASIKEVIDMPDASMEGAFIRDVDRFLIAVSDESDLMRERAARLHRPLARRLIQEKKASAGFRYAYALVDKSSAEFSFLRNAEELSAVVNAVEDTRAMPEIYAAIEEMEVHYVLGRSVHLRTLGAAIDALRIKADAIPEEARFIKHHLGKFYLWLEKYDEAAALFDALLSECPEFAEARLQRANTHVRKKEIDLALKQCENILQQRRTQQTVTVTVLLAVFQLIARHAKERAAAFVTDYRVELRSALQAGVATGHPQALDALAVLAKALSYNSSALLIELTQDVSEWPVRSNREQFAWAQTLKELGKANSGDPVGRKHLEDAARWYEKTHAARDYEAHQTAEGFLLVDRPGEALRVLDQSKPDPDAGEHSAFWFYRRSQAQRKLKQIGDALVSINRALELLEQKMMRSAFLEQRFLVRHDQGDESATEDLRAAIDLATGQYKVKLERLLDQIINAQ
jgi:tetratricopeptide (TPR) repeat protein